MLYGRKMWPHFHSRSRPLPVAMAADQRKLRILCLHGFTQNAEVFRQRTGALRKFCKAHATFGAQCLAPAAATGPGPDHTAALGAEFMDAPFLAPKENIFTAPSVSSECAPASARLGAPLASLTR